MAQELGTVYNATASALVVDQAGRVIGAGEFGVAPVNEQPGKGQLEAGQLIAVTVPDGKRDDESIAESARRADKSRRDRTAKASAAAADAAKSKPAKATTTPPTTITEA